MASILMIMLRPLLDSTPVTTISLRLSSTLTPALLVALPPVNAPKRLLKVPILPTKDGRSSPRPSGSIPKPASLVLTSGTATPSPLPDGTTDPPAIMASTILTETDLHPLTPVSLSVVLGASLMRTPGPTGKRPNLISGMTAILTAKLVAP